MVAPPIAPVRARAAPYQIPNTAPPAMISRNAGSMKTTAVMYAATYATGAQIPSDSTQTAKEGSQGDSQRNISKLKARGTTRPIKRINVRRVGRGRTFRAFGCGLMGELMKNCTTRANGMYTRGGARLRDEQIE